MLRDAGPPPPHPGTPSQWRPFLPFFAGFPGAFSGCFLGQTVTECGPPQPEHACLNPRMHSKLSEEPHGPLPELKLLQMVDFAFCFGLPLGFGAEVTRAKSEGW